MVFTWFLGFNHSFSPRSFKINFTFFCFLVLPMFHTVCYCFMLVASLSFFCRFVLCLVFWHFLFILCLAVFSVLLFFFSFCGFLVPYFLSFFSYFAQYQLVFLFICFLSFCFLFFLDFFSFFLGSSYFELKHFSFAHFKID